MIPIIAFITLHYNNRWLNCAKWLQMDKAKHLKQHANFIDVPSCFF